MLPSYALFEMLYIHTYSMPMEPSGKTSNSELALPHSRLALLSQWWIFQKIIHLHHSWRSNPSITFLSRYFCNPYLHKFLPCFVFIVHFCNPYLGNFLHVLYLWSTFANFNLMCLIGGYFCAHHVSTCRGIGGWGTEHARGKGHYTGVSFLYQ